MYPNQDYIPPQPPKKEGKIKFILFISIIIILTNVLVGTIAFMYGKFISQEPKQKESTFYNIPTTTLTPTATTTQIKHLTLTPILSPIPDFRKEKSIILSIENSLSGYVESSSNSANTRKNILIGETDSGFARGFMTFDIKKIPAQAKVTSAVLRFEIDYEILPSQYGKLYIDHITYGDSLDATDYALSSLVSNIAQVKIAKNKAEADITKAVANDVENARGKSQVRIHYEIEKRFANSLSTNLQIPKQSIFLEVKYN